MADTQHEPRKGWSWFDRDEPNGEDHAPADGIPDAGREQRLAYARCFAGPDGEKVLHHLRAITLDRSFGPDVSAQTLRHMEGQRQLVSYILAQYERGRLGD